MRSAIRRKEPPLMPRRSRPTIIVASLLAAACLGAGGGAVAYATLHDNGTSTVVKQVTVQQADQASSSPLSVNQIYRRAYRGVVEITVTEAATSTPFGGGGGTAQAQGSGWVYDSDGHIVTNDHVVDGSTSIKVRFWDGKTYSATVVGVDAQIKSDSGGNEGVGFSIPSATVKTVASQLIATGKAVHAYLGVRIDATAPNALLAGAQPNTPARKAGLKKGDVITAVDGTA